MKLLRSALLLSFLVAVFGSVGARAQPATPEIDPSTGLPEFTITATNSGFEVPSPVPSGLNVVNFVNTGDAGAGMFFWLLPAGVTAEQLAGDLPTREPGSTGQAPAAFYEADLPGAPGYAEAGESTSAIVNLKPGNYVVLTEEGEWPAPLEVVQTAESPSPTVEPETDLVIDLQEFAFKDLPATLLLGSQRWKITNIGHQPHQMIVGKVPDGMTLQQVLAGFQPPPGGTPVPGAMTRAEFHSIGGLEIMSPGNTAWSNIEFDQEGTYAVVCLVPDQTTGELHVAEGMAAVFEITA